MNLPVDGARQEDAISRLRELYEHVVGEDRPRVALLLGLALADKAASLPDLDRRHGELASEGVLLLDESGDGSPSVLRARELLARSRQLNQGPDSFQLGGGELNWDVNWEVLRGPSEAAMNLRATLPMLASGLPPGAPLRLALSDIVNVLEAFDQGLWTPQKDAVLKNAIHQVAEAGLGHGIAWVLRSMAMLIRIQRCRRAEEEGKRPDWPPVADIDTLIAEADPGAMAEDLRFGPIEPMTGLPYLMMAALVIMRLAADIRSRSVRPDIAWRDNALRLLDEADAYLDQAPSAYAGLVRQLRNALARPRADLLKMTASPAAAPPSRRTSPPPHIARSADARPSGADQVDEVPDGAVIEGSASRSLWQGLFGQIPSPSIIAGIQIMAQAGNSAAVTATAHLAAMLDSVFAQRWTERAEREFAALEQQADQLNDQRDSSLSDRAEVAAELAVARVLRYEVTSARPRLAERPPTSEAVGLVAQIEAAIELLATVAAESPANTLFTIWQAVLHAMAASLLTELGRPGGDNPDADLIRRSREHTARIPTELIERLPSVAGDFFLLQELVADGRLATAEETERLASHLGAAFETTGVTIPAAEAAVAAARRNPDLASLGTALNELNQAGIALPAGSPLHFHRLILLAETQTLMASHTNDKLAIKDAIGSAIEAGRLASTPGEHTSVARQMVTIFSLMASQGYREGSFEQAEEFLRAALTHAAADDWPLRVIATVGVGAAVDLRAKTRGDEGLHEEAVRLIADAEQLLPSPVPTADWYGAATALYQWTAMRAIDQADAQLVPIALRVSEMLEGILAGAPSATEMASEGTRAQQLAALRQGRARLVAVAEGSGAQPVSPAAARLRSPSAAEDADRLARRTLERLAAMLSPRAVGQPRFPLSGAGHQDQASLLGAMSDLHKALAGITADVRLSRQVDEALGRCAAEMYWSHPDAGTMETLREAIVHLNRALTAGVPELPTPQRADLLDVLACCWHEVALRHESEGDRAHARAESDRAARAAIRELASCVLLTEDTAQALTIAARANDVVARGIGWCLADGNYRAAVDMAEAGRGLVLASVVLAGQVEEVLRGVGEHDIADGWRTGGLQGRIAALEAMWKPGVSAKVLASPTVDEVSIMLAATDIDALAYLIPPAAPDSDHPDEAVRPVDPPGHAVLVRPLAGQIEVLTLPGLGGSGREPLAAYLAALDEALRSYDAEATNEEGFRGGPGGPAWADSLIELGSWAYDRIMGPLIEHSRGWKLGRRPHVALIPLGELAAIPYATAWTQDARSPDSRRYAIEDMVLTYAASARLLVEVSLRPRQRLGERVVLVSDPTGQFTMTRVAARLLARHQYPEAESYGLKSAPCGPATAGALLRALPGTDWPGASVLHLATHGTTDPAPRLQTYDGWLALDQILDQARGRAPAAPGGLVITSACLTDSTRTNYDESVTLATAFLAAGACSVIGTRWPVDDDTTAALTLRLHYHLHAGKRPAEALRCAQLDLLRPARDIRKSLGPHLEDIDESRLRHPASWAGYVHHGTDTSTMA